MRHVSVVIGIVAAGVLLAPAVRAQEDAPHEDPSASGSTGLFEVPRATTREGVGFGVFYETLNREEGATNFERGAVVGSVGIGDRFEIFGSFEVRDGLRREFIRERFLGIPDVLAPRLNEHPFAAERWQEGLGDLRLGGKILLAGEPHAYTGLAAQVVFKAPTANDEDGIGTSTAELGGDLIASIEAGDVLGLNGYGGYNWRRDPDEFELANDFRWGIGVQVPTRTVIQAIGELYGVRYLGEPDEDERPLIGPGFKDYTVLQGGLRLTFDNGLAFSGGLNRTLGIDQDIPGGGEFDFETWGSFVMVSFSSRPSAPPPPSPPPAVKREMRISCRAERTSLREGESVRLFAETSDATGVVKMSWSSSQGKLSSTTGTEVTWSSEGMKPGETATITVTATDASGQSVTCTVRVSIAAAPPPPQPTVRRLVCSDFAAGSARIDNRCKAVLDDVALLLRGNPDATVTLTGVGDAGGRADLGMTRARNAEQYLLRTHGVSAGAITTSSEPGSSGREGSVEIAVTIPAR